MTAPVPGPPMTSQVPNPYFEDPTALTTAAVDKAMTQMRRELATLREIIEARILALENDAELRLESLRAVRPQTERQINHLRELTDEKFNSIELQFKERDVRTEQAASASKQALDAALLAAKELVGQQNTANVEAAAKAEASFTKQIDQIGVIISTLEKAITDRILELKERIDRGEGSTAGVQVQKQEGRQFTGLVFGAIGLAFTTLIIIIAVLGYVAAHHG